MPITMEQGEQATTIRLEGAIGIAEAEELKAALLAAVSTGPDQAGRSLRLSLAGASDLDVTALQLLWAARRAAENAGAGFEITDTIAPGIRSTLAGAGLERVLDSLTGIGQ